MLTVSTEMYYVGSKHIQLFLLAVSTETYLCWQYARTRIYVGSKHNNLFMLAVKSTGTYLCWQ